MRLGGDLALGLAYRYKSDDIMQFPRRTLLLNRHRTLFLVLLYGSAASAANLVSNPSFETVGASNPASFTGLHGAVGSAAASWLIWNNTTTTTTTELCPGGPNCSGAPAPIDGSEVIH